MKTLIFSLMVLLSTTFGFAAPINVTLDGPECVTVGSQNTYTGEITTTRSFWCVRPTWEYVVTGGFIVGVIDSNGNIIPITPTTNREGDGTDVEQIIVEFSDNNTCASVSFTAVAPGSFLCNRSEDTETIGVHVNNFVPDAASLDLTTPSLPLSCGSNATFTLTIDSECDYEEFVWLTSNGTFSTTVPTLTVNTGNCNGSFGVTVIATGPCNNQFTYSETFPCDNTPPDISYINQLCLGEFVEFYNDFCASGFSNVNFEVMLNTGENTVAIMGCGLRIFPEHVGTIDILVTYTYCGVESAEFIRFEIEICEFPDWERQEQEGPATSAKRDGQHNQGQKRTEQAEKAAAFSPAIKVFPNPVQDQLTIEGANVESFAITAIDQKVWISQRTGSDRQQKIDVSALPPGVYILSIRTPDELLTKKFIKH